MNNLFRKQLEDRIALLCPDCRPLIEGLLRDDYPLDEWLRDDDKREWDRRRREQLRKRIVE